MAARDPLPALLAGKREAEITAEAIQTSLDATSSKE
jgi:hypothetical protein